MSVSKMRTDYVKSELTEKLAGNNPIALLENWLQMAVDSKVLDANAMNIATVDAAGFPQSRIVLLRYIRDNNLFFFTNYESNKAQEIFARGKVGVHFFWPELEKQIRISCTAVKSSSHDSNDYFATRPRESQIGAWASQQSQILDSRKTLENKIVEFNARFEGKPVPRPDNWGGIVLQPVSFEFWQGRASRLHDRLHFLKSSDGSWTVSRLYP